MLVNGWLNPSFFTITIANTTAIIINGSNSTIQDKAPYPVLHIKSRINVQNKMYIAFNTKISVLSPTLHLYSPIHNSFVSPKFPTPTNINAIKEITK